MMKRGILKVVVKQDFIKSCCLTDGNQRYNLHLNRFYKHVAIKNLNEANIGYEIERGKVVSIVHGNSKIYEIPEAQAPYNFVPLNSNTEYLHGNIAINNSYTTNSSGHSYTGYIDLDCINFTPLYIRGTINTLTDNSNHHSGIYTSASGNKTNINHYSPGNIKKIPGSSLRGMIRTMMEISSFSKFGFFNDSIHYFRSFADESEAFRAYYNQYMDESSIKAGLIYKDGRHHRLIPGGTIRQTTIIRKNRQCFERTSPGEYRIYSGYINGKTHDWIINCDEDKTRSVLIYNQDITDYEKDSNRNKSAIHLIKECNEAEFVPCFYFEWQDVDNNLRYTLGHTRFFRMPYLNSIATEFKPNDLTSNTNDDFIESLFGSLNRGGKLFFEDLVLVSGEEETPSIPMNLSTPKPTSFQLYLEQGDKPIENLNHYDSDNVIIRGNKLYWHKSETCQWKATNSITEQEEAIKNITEGIDKQKTIIAPIKPGGVFKGRIRFENISDIELGGLLFVLKLKPGFCHKIGMAKPLGLGTISITPSLFLSNRMNRYQNLLSEWTVPLNSESNLSQFVDAFRNAVWAIIDPSKVNQDLWTNPRLKQLAIMLDWNNKPPDSLTKYMELKDFRLRMVLPSPKDVITKKR